MNPIRPAIAAFEKRILAVLIRASMQLAQTPLLVVCASVGWFASFVSMYIVMGASHAANAEHDPMLFVGGPLLFFMFCTNMCWFVVLLLLPALWVSPLTTRFKWILSVIIFLFPWFGGILTLSYLPSQDAEG